MVTPKSDHWAAHSRFQGSLALPPNGLIVPAVPQPRAQVTSSGRHSKATVSPSQPVTIVVPILPHVGQMTLIGCQRVGMLDVGDPAVDVADHGRPVERGPDVRIHRPGRVDLAHPVVAIRVDAEARERVDEDPGEMARVAGVAVAGRIGDVRQRPAHLALDRVRRQERLGVHRVEVVDAVQERRLDAGSAQRPGDGVEDDRTTQAADVDGA